LIDPLTKEPLKFDEASDSLRSAATGKNFLLIESVPRIILDDNKSIAKSKIHLEYNSDFNYSDHYQKDAFHFDYSEQDMSSVTRNEFTRLRESILKEITDDHSIVLDVGCGKGWVSGSLIPRGNKVISMDISTDNPVNAVRSLPHINHAGLIADVYNIPLKENSVDCIVASEIMEHLPDPKVFIINLLKILKRKGKLIITVPYNEAIEYYLCVHCNRPTPKSAHLHSFTESNIKDYFPHEGIIMSHKKFLNKYLSRIKSYLILKYLPFSVWLLIDGLFNKVFNKPTRLQIVIIKE
jgi:2-polyprenyl-3-methyl-5-hydroxy-6-metoxy-1,4-benzoquinol methylase